LKLFKISLHSWWITCNSFSTPWWKKKRNKLLQLKCYLRNSKSMISAYRNFFSNYLNLLLPSLAAEKSPRPKNRQSGSSLPKPKEFKRKK